MKFRIFSMVVILGMLSVLSMMYTGNFNPLSYLPQLDNKAKAPENVSTVVTDKRVEVYRWRDENGVMQFSNRPPDAGTAEQVVLDPNSNLVQASSVTQEKNSTQEQQTGPPNPYSVSGMKKIMDDARAVEGMLQQHNEQRLKTINGM